MRQTIYALVFSVLSTTAAWGQDAGPRLLPTGEAGIAPIVKQTAFPAAQAPVDRSGRIRGTSVTDRLGEIRRRAVDADISRPFSVTDEKDLDLIELHGALPAVPRRSVEKTAPQKVSRRLQSQPRQQVVIPQPVSSAPSETKPQIEPETQLQPERKLHPEPKLQPEPGLQPEPSLQPEIQRQPETQLQPGTQAKPATPPLAATRPVATTPPVAATPAPVTTPPLASTQPMATTQLATTQPPVEPTTQPPVEPTIQPAPNSKPVPRIDPQPKSDPFSALPDPKPASQLTMTPVHPESVATPRVVPIKPIPVAVETREIVQESDILLSNQVPSLSFETAGPKTIRIGREARYRISMFNRGNADARDVIVKVHLPAWAEITRSNSTVGAPQVELDRDRNFVVTWELGQLTIDGKEDLMLGIVPRDSRPFDLSVGWTLAAAQSTTQIEVQEPKLEMVVNGAQDVLYGETSIYSIILSNPGTGDAENVTLSLMPLTPHQDIAGTRTIGTLKAGERKTIELELTAHQAGQLQVRAIANAEGGLRADAAQEVLVRRANLDVAIIGPPRNFAGTEATYKVRIENTGDATAEQAAAAAVIPATASYLSSNDGGKFDSANNRIQWIVGTLRPGAVRVLEFRCVLEAAGENRIDISSMADGDVQLTKSVVTQVEALADLKLYVNDPKGAVSVGQDSIYEVKIVNRGTKTAEDINVVGYFSEGIEPLDVRGWRGSVSTGQVQFEPISKLNAGQELVFRITARATAPGNHVFRAEIECSEPETRLAAEEWTKYYGSAKSDVRQASRPRRQQLAAPQAGASQEQGQFYLPEVKR